MLAFGLTTQAILNVKYLMKDTRTLVRISSWAVSTIMTRQNAIPLVRATKDDATTDETPPTTEDESQTPALIPFWDLANHIDGHVTTSYNDTEHQIEATTLADVPKGEQIFIHYGNRNNANLLVHNG